MGVAVLPLALGTLVAANLAALRSTRAGADELLDTLPQDVRVRTGAQLLALFAVVPLAVGLVALAYLLFEASDGLIVSQHGTRRVPAFVELAQGPLLVLALGAFGVLLGRVLPFAQLAALLVVVIVFAEVPLAAWAPETSLRWAVPLVNDIVAVPNTWVPCEPGSGYLCGEIARFDTAAMAWHLLALAVVALTAAGAALARGRAARAGLAATALAVVATTTLVAA
ncbi:hypothetical protein [Solirubrobacter soli]|uniref:hypothetical protein n=1 Tax=Solirubrobacter soli TaxID=363832 RepID=UPI0003FACAA1|nr:hypothetical protein [Solirubrobacter soli]